MKQSRIEKGVHVIIGNDLSKTQRFHGTNMVMQNMRGESHIITKRKAAGYGVCAEIVNFSWHPDDLKEVCPKKKAQIFHFDVKKLST